MVILYFFIVSKEKSELAKIDIRVPKNSLTLLILYLMINCLKIS